MSQRRGSDQQPGNSEVIIPPSLDEIAPILCVADEVEASNPRIAYLCKLQLLCLEIWNSFEVLLSPFNFTRKAYWF